MNKRIVYLWGIIVFLLLNASSMYSYDYLVDGIRYNRITGTTGEVEVAELPTPFYDVYSGDISIPEAILVSGVTFRVTAIGANAFRNQSIKSIQIPNSVTSIGKSAFEDCHVLMYVSLPNSIKKIPDRCFYMTGIYSIRIPESVEVIGNYAFYCGLGHHVFEIPSSVTSIGNYAFDWLSLLISRINEPFPVAVTTFGINKEATLYVPQGTKDKYNVCSGWSNNFSKIEELSSSSHVLSINSIGDGEIWCNGTKIRNGSSSFTVNENIPISIYFRKDEGKTLKNVKVNGVDVTSSQTINSYGYYSFPTISNDTNVEVEFESTPPTSYALSITATGYGSASYNSTAIRNTTKTFTVNEGTSATISIAPDNGYKIKSVKKNGTDVTSSVSNNKYTVSNIQSNISVEVEFEAITHTLTIKANGNGSASYNSTAIRNTTKTFTINEGTSATISITPDDSYRLKSVKKGGTDVTTSVSNNIFTVSNIQSDTSVEVEFEAITHTLSIKATGNGVAIYDGTNISNKTTSFIVNEGSSAVVQFTPDNGYQIKSVKLNSTNITSNVYNSQYIISNITADTSLEVEFESISNIIDFEDANVKAICVANWDTDGDDELSEEEAAAIDDIGRSFYSNRELTSFNELQYFTGLTKIDDYSFQNCSGLISVIIPSNVTSIGKDAFRSCTALTNIAIPNSVTNIGEEAFQSCSSLRSINIGNSVANIGILAFSDCKDLMNVTVEKGNTKYDSRNSCNAIIETAINALLCGCKTTIIPNSITSIAAYAFSDCIGLTNITLPNSIESIGYSAFSGCKGLTNVIIPSSVTSIGNGAFSCCTGLTDIVIPNSVTSIGGGTFSMCTSLTDITIPNSVMSIDIDAFDGCKSLTSITIPNSVMRIGNGAFRNCSGLTSVSVEYGNTKYDSRNNCNAIIETASNTLITGCKNTAIPNSVTSIGGGAFLGCTGLKDIIIPNSVTSIGMGAFSGCSNLFQVCSKIEKPFAITNIVFNGIPDNSELYVPYGTKSLYEATTGWNVFSKIIEEKQENPQQHELVVVVSGNGSVFFDGKTVRNQSCSFSIIDGTTIIITFSPDDGCRIKSVKVNSVNVSSSITYNQYTIDNITTDTSLEVEFEANPTLFACEGINYSVASYDDKTVRLAKGNYGKVLEIPATISYMASEWTVIGMDDDAFDNAEEIAAIIWHPEVFFNATISNPNLLLYVNNSIYAPNSVNNVVVNGTASSVTLTDAESGNNFYCPQEFTAQHISYSHNYKMTTGIGIAKGWETIALPFDVQTVMHEEKGEIVPFAKWQSGDSTKPFWLMRLEENGWKAADGIKANTPYIISMPNNGEYKDEFLLNGRVTFSAENVTIRKTENMQTASYKGRTFVPSYSEQAMGSGFYVLNVSNDYETNISGVDDGSRFVLNLRKVHPFEAYMITSTNGTRSIDISDGMDDGIDEEEKMPMRVYNLKGLMMKIEEGKSMEEIKQTLPSGVYIINGHKMIVK